MEGSLDALVSGKRESPRHRVAYEAIVKGARAEFPARMLDLSLDGALISIPLEALDGTPGEPLGPAEQFGLLEGHFREPFDIHVPSCGVVMEAQVVRLLVSADEGEDVSFGCRFAHTLTESQQRKLGLRREDEDALMPWGEATLLHDIRCGAREDRPVSAMLAAEGDAILGPRFLGQVTAIGRRAILIRLPGLDREEAVGALAAPGIRARILHGSRELCESSCEPISLRYIDAPRPGVEVLLALADRLPRAVRTHFARA